MKKIAILTMGVKLRERKDIQDSAILRIFW